MIKIALLLRSKILSPENKLQIVNQVKLESEGSINSNITLKQPGNTTLLNLLTNQKIRAKETLYKTNAILNRMIEKNSNIQF